MSTFPIAALGRFALANHGQFPVPLFSHLGLYFFERLARRFMKQPDFGEDRIQLVRQMHPDRQLRIPGRVGAARQPVEDLKIRMRMFPR